MRVCGRWSRTNDDGASGSRHRCPDVGANYPSLGALTQARREFEWPDRPPKDVAPEARCIRRQRGCRPIQGGRQSSPGRPGWRYDMPRDCVAPPGLRAPAERSLSSGSQRRARTSVSRCGSGGSPGPAMPMSAVRRSRSPRRAGALRLPAQPWPKAFLEYPATDAVRATVRSSAVAVFPHRGMCGHRHAATGRLPPRSRRPSRLAS